MWFSKYFSISLQGYTEEMIKKELLPRKPRGPKKKQKPVKKLNLQNIF